MAASSVKNNSLTLKVAFSPEMSAAASASAEGARPTRPIKSESVAVRDGGRQAQGERLRPTSARVKAKVSDIYYVTHRWGRDGGRFWRTTGSKRPS